MLRGWQGALVVDILYVCAIIMFRYIGDPIAFKANSKITDIKRDLYISNLNFFTTNVNPLKENYLNLEINVTDSKLS